MSISFEAIFMFTLIKEQLEKHNYRFIELIGRGGYSVCMKVASARYPDEEFACKLIVLNDAAGAEETYYTEIKALSTINNLNIVNIYDYFIEENAYFIILEYCCNGSLDRLVSHDKTIHGDLLMRYMKTIFDAVNHLHYLNIAHHDIKPANFFIDKYGRAKLGDFGITKKYDEEKFSNNHRGSLPYAPPEVISGQPYDPFKADIWSLGVSIYQLGMGKLPFIGPTRENTKALIRSGKYDPPESLGPIMRGIVEKCLQTDPNARPSSEELVEILGSAMKPFTINLNQRKPRIFMPGVVKSNSCFTNVRLLSKLPGKCLNSRISSYRSVDYYSPH